MKIKVEHETILMYRSAIRYVQDQMISVSKLPWLKSDLKYCLPKQVWLDIKKEFEFDYKIYDKPNNSWEYEWYEFIEYMCINNYVQESDIEIYKAHYVQMYQYAIYYALGRRTYITSYAVDWTRMCNKVLSKSDKDLLVYAIMKRIFNGTAGDSCDISNWKTIIEILKN